MIFKFQSHVVFFLFCCFFTSSSWSQDNTNEPPAIANYNAKLRVIAKSLDVQELQAVLSGLESTKEAYDTLSQRLQSFPDQYDILSVENIDQVFSLLFDAFSPMASLEDREMLNDLYRWVELSPIDPEISRKFILLNLKIKDIPQKQKFPTAQELFLGKNIKAGSSSDFKEQADAAFLQVNNFYSFLERKVVGQDEVLQAFKNMYLTDLMNNGHRSKPELFYLIGLPGNGKDTAAEALADALWRTDGAHKEHMFRINARSKEEAWSYFGSGKGYIGSTELPAFLKFLVDHSGGKYLLNKEGVGSNQRMVIERNPNWNPSDFTLQPTPNKAVIFINEAHNIPKEVKDNLFKQAIEYGIFPITNPGEGPNAATYIELPVTFIFASNEGISLLEPREKNGARTGAPLKHDALEANYQRVYRDKPALKQSIMATNGDKNSTRLPNAPGISEEFLNRFPDYRILILRPFDSDNLSKITKIAVLGESNRLKNASGPFGRYSVELSQDAVQFITTYDAIASENARPIKGRLESFVFKQINEALLSKDLIPTPDMQDIFVDIQKNADGSRSTHFIVRRADGTSYEFTRLIDITLKDVPKPPLSDERIKEILSLREKIISNAFGVEHIVDRLIDAALVSESEARNSNASGPATILAFLGITSTGKTETARQYAKARYGEDAKIELIDFNGIQTVQAMNAKILGTTDTANNPIASDFMKAYDRANGNIAFIFDEAANSPKELLKSLFEILRASEAIGFSDGKPRSMKNVTIILTGNAGEKIYKMLPQNLPSDIYERAQHEAFRLFMENPDLQQRVLQETFPDALIARLSSNIYFFGPLTHSSKRQVSQMKLLNAMKDLKSKPSERGWNIHFASEADLLKLFDLIEIDGFNSNHQGASIDTFIRLSFKEKIKSALLANAIPNNDSVTLTVDDVATSQKKQGREQKSRHLHLTTSSGKVLDIEVPLPEKTESIPFTESDRILVAYHEVGHEVVSEVYFGDQMRPQYLSIIPGVTLIGSSFVHYAGIRSGESLSRGAVTKQVVLRKAAVLMGGYVAQQMTTIGARHDAGKQNDMHRATELIQDAILRYGLSTQWGMRSIPEGVATEDYIDKELSPEEKVKLNAIIDRWMSESERLAREALFVNIDNLFLKMSKTLAEQGHLEANDILRIYEEAPPVTERSPNYDQKIAEVKVALDYVDELMKTSFDDLQKIYRNKRYSVNDAKKVLFLLENKNLFSKVTSYFRKAHWDTLTPLQKSVVASYLGNKVRDQNRDARIAGDYWLPTKVADIEKVLEQERKMQVEPVTNIPKFSFASSGPVRCEALFSK